MSVTTTPLSGQIGGNVVVDTTSDATAENDVRSGATTLYRVQIDNRNNSSAVYTKIWDAAAPTVGTTDPDWVIRCEASQRKTFVIKRGVGATIATGLSFATVTTGGTAGTTSPTNAVIVWLHTA